MPSLSKADLVAQIAEKTGETKKSVEAVLDATWSTIVDNVAKGNDVKVLGFRDEYRFLSNFWFAKVVFDGETYRTVEHAYQAAKTPVPGERAMIQAANLPGEAKRLGRGVTMRRDWDSVKVAIMTDLVGQKFQNAELRRKLLASGTVPILELNSWGDRTWGVIEDKGGRLIGANQMGRILMDLRARLAAA